VVAVVLVGALLEVALLVRFAEAAGPRWTFAVLVGSSLAGVVVLSRLGRRPGERALDLFSAALLLLPGLLSSAAGLVLLVPAVRRAVRARWWAWARRRGLIDSTGPATVIVMEPLERHDAPPAPPGQEAQGGTSRPAEPQDPTTD
jgi:UPF0716 protein FxsA